MKTKIYIILIAMTLFSISKETEAQSYFTAGGARLGTDWGISMQQKIFNHTTVEGIFQSSFFREELLLTVIPEYHFPLITKRLNLYAGAGLHKGFHTSSEPEYESPFGMSLIGGIEFTFARFVFSYDYKPVINFTGGENKWYNQTGITIRYVFIKQNAFKKMKRKRDKRKRKEERIEKRENK
jgi:hypothetical protein